MSTVHLLIRPLWHHWEGPEWCAAAAYPLPWHPSQRSINSVRVSLKLPQADQLDCELTRLYMKFLMQVGGVGVADTSWCAVMAESAVPDECTSTLGCPLLRPFLWLPLGAHIACPATGLEGEGGFERPLLGSSMHQLGDCGC